MAGAFLAGTGVAYAAVHGSHCGAGTTASTTSTAGHSCPHQPAAATASS